MKYVIVVLNSERVPRCVVGLYEDQKVAANEARSMYGDDTEWYTMPLLNPDENAGKCPAYVFVTFDDGTSQAHAWCSVQAVNGKHDGKHAATVTRIDGSKFTIWFDNKGE